MTVWAYYRVSTDKQDYESQKVGVVDYAKRSGLKIEKEVIDDGVSGTVIAEKRNLGILLDEMQEGDTIIVSELSRLGRSTADVIKTCTTIADRKVNCYLVKQGMQIDQSPMGKLMITIFSAFAEMERDLIAMRTKEGIARARASGKKIGRQFGQKNASSILDDQKDFIIEKYNDGWSLHKIGVSVGKSARTIRRKLQDWGFHEPNRQPMIKNQTCPEERELNKKMRELARQEQQIKTLKEQTIQKKAEIKRIKGGWQCGNIRIFE